VNVAGAPRDPTAGFEQLLDYRRQLLGRLEAQPGEFAAAVAAIPASAWHMPRDRLGRNLLDIAAHLRDVETQVFLPRIRRMLAEDNPVLTLEASHDEASAGSEREAAMTTILAGWSQARAELAALVRPLAPAGWTRAGFYPPAGTRTVQWWVERAYGHARDHQHALQSEGRQ
jgi:hypothetical protein